MILRFPWNLRVFRASVVSSFLLVFPVVLAHGQGALAAPPPANRSVYLDKADVVRWRDNRLEVALFGANYVLPTASDYRAAG